MDFPAITLRSGLRISMDLNESRRMLFAERRIPDPAWNYWWEVGRRRSEHHAARATSEYTHPNSHELGAIGEFYFGWLVGLRAADDLNEVAGDDGFDFPNVDVKAAEIIKYPWLKVRTEKVQEAPAAFAFVLVAVDIPRRHARYCGYATKEMLQRIKPERIRLRADRSSELTGRPRSASEGPLSHIIRNESSLIRALPAGLNLCDVAVRGGALQI